jgi:hypothetical protein
VKIAVYTANIGKNVKNIPDDKHHFETGVDYIYFTDNKNIKSDKWNVVYVENPHENTKISPGNRIFAKEIKMTFWNYLSGYDWVVWVDAHHTIQLGGTRSPGLGKYISKIPDDIDIVFKKHTGKMPAMTPDGKIIEGGDEVRKYDIYDEIKHIRYHPYANLENQNELAKWENELLAAKYPSKSGLIETNKIIWRFDYRHVSRKFNSEWFELSTQRFRRDQLTINYLIWNSTELTKHTKIDYLDDIVKTEKVKEEKTDTAMDEWGGNWDVNKS